MNTDAATLAAAVRTVLPATRSGHLPVLKGVRLEAGDGLQRITATDLELTIIAELEIDSEAIDAIVPASLLAGWLEGVDGEVSLKLSGADLVLTSESGTFRLRTLPIDDWPRCEVAEGDQVDLDRRIGGILYAASRDGARPILTGVGIGNGWACCTDSYQLSAVKLDGLPNAIIPVKLLELALKNEGDPVIALDDRRVTVWVGATTGYTGRLIEGTFPNWQPLVGEPKTTVTLDRERTIAALERVLVLADAETPVRVIPSGEGLTFTVVSRDVGEIVERVDGGIELGGEYGFRPRLLINLLRSRDEAKVELGVTDQFKPVSIRSEESVALVMPVRL